MYPFDNLGSKMAIGAHVVALLTQLLVVLELVEIEPLGVESLVHLHVVHVQNNNYQLLENMLLVCFHSRTNPKFLAHQK